MIIFILFKFNMSNTWPTWISLCFSELLGPHEQAVFPASIKIEAGKK